MNVPNILTLVRISLIPFFVVLFYVPLSAGNHLLSAIIFAVASITDWFDGFLARYLHQTSKLGAFLDPVADKLIVAVALVLLVSDPRLPLLAIPAAIIVGREIVISALREWMAELGKRASVAVSFIGKLKTLLQMLAIIMLLVYKPGGEKQWIGILGYLLLYLSVGLTLWSMIVYLKAAWHDLTFEKK